MDDFISDAPDEYWDEDDDFIAYLPEGRVLDMLRYPDNRHLY